ncbi:hypothetical protein IV102_15475 [bacterium]|nr:hypothetical protein [bacterium]
MIQSNFNRPSTRIATWLKQPEVHLAAMDLDRNESGYAGSAKVGDSGLMSSPLQMANVRWQMREQENSSDVGHAWLEVDDPDRPGETYSAGAMPGPGLVSPDPGAQDKANSNYGRDKFHWVKEYTTTPDEDRRMIRFLKGQVERSKQNPERYWSPSGKGLKIEAIETNACTTTSGRLLRKTLDPSAPVDILQPNDLYNHYHPSQPLPPGPLPITEIKPAVPPPPGPLRAGKGAQK